MRRPPARLRGAGSVALPLAAARSVSMPFGVVPPLSHSAMMDGSSLLVDGRAMGSNLTAQADG